MSIIVRSAKQLGEALRRQRRLKGETQQSLGERMSVRQATVSKLESGEPRTEISVLVSALAALDLEIVIRPRSKGSQSDIAGMF